MLLGFSLKVAGVTRKILLLVLVALAALLLGRALRHETKLPLTSGGWTAAQSGATFVESGVNRDQHMALVLAPGGATLRLTGDPAKLPAGEDIPLHATFDDNTSFALTGTGIGGAVEAPLDPASIAPFTQHLAHDGSVVFSFDDQQEPPLAFPLAGAAPTLAALRQAMRHAGLAGGWNSGGWVAAPGMMAGALGLSVGWFLTALALMYFLPAVIAYARASSSRGIILVLNLLLGWTVIGWWVLLVIAIVSPVRMQRGLRQA
jgi:hypothetical protein